MNGDYNETTIKDIVSYDILSVQTRKNTQQSTLMKIRQGENIIQLKYKKKHDFNMFCYYIQKQYSFGIKHDLENPIRIKECSDIILTDCDMNFIGTFSKEDNLLKNLIPRYSNAYSSQKEFCFSGEYLKDGVGVKVKSFHSDFKIPVFFPHPTSEATQKIIINDEIKYIQTDNKPNQSLEIVYIFNKDANKLVYEGVMKSNWIY